MNSQELDPGASRDILVAYLRVTSGQGSEGTVEGIPGLASFIYHPSVKVAPLPLLSLFRKIKMVVMSSVLLQYEVMVSFFPSYIYCPCLQALPLHSPFLLSSSMTLFIIPFGSLLSFNRHLSPKPMTHRFVPPTYPTVFQNVPCHGPCSSFHRLPEHSIPWSVHILETYKYCAVLYY